MNVLKISLIGLCLGISQFVSAQSGTIKGVVYEKEGGGETMYSVSIYVAETKQTASTDGNGLFTIAGLPAGTYTISFSNFGYLKHTDTVTLKPGRMNASLKIYLEKESNTLEEHVVSAETTEKQTTVHMSVIKATKKDILRIPAIGGEPDIATYLQTIPGVVTTGDQGGQLYVRGGSPIQNKVLMDGMIIYNPFHSIGFYSVFDTDIIKGADVYTGGYNAQHGGRISSVIDITTRDGNKNKFSGKFSANPFGAKALLEGPIRSPKKKNEAASMSYLLSGRTSYLAQSSKLLYSYVNNDGQGLPFNFTDLYGKFSANSGTGSKFNLFGFNFTDSVTYKSISKLKWNSYGAGTNFVMLLPGSPILTEGHFAYSKYEISLDDKTNPLRKSSVSGFNGGFDFKYFLKRDEIKYGVEVIGYTTDFITYNSVNREIRQNENTTEIAAYLVYKFSRGQWLIEPGFRAHYYASLRNFSPEPRIGIKFNATDKLRFKGASGIYSQNLIQANSDRDVVNLFYGFLSGSSNIPNTYTNENGEVVERKHSLQKAIHYILGAEYDFTDNITFNVEGYYKNFTQLTNINRNKVYEDDGSTTYPDIFKKDFIIETGKAYGVDFTFKYSQKNTYIWLAYSLAKVTRWDGLVTYAPVWDRRHNVNVVFTQIMGKSRLWEANMRWNLGTGLPFTQTQGYYASITQGSISGNPNTVNPNDLSYVYGQLGAGRLPTYHRMDISVKRKIQFWNKQKKKEDGTMEKKEMRSQMEITAGATNLYNRANVFYVERSTQEVVRQLPLIPTIGFNWEF